LIKSKSKEFSLLQENYFFNIFVLRNPAKIYSDRYYSDGWWGFYVVGALGSPFKSVPDFLNIAALPWFLLHQFFINVVT